MIAIFGQPVVVIIRCTTVDTSVPEKKQTFLVNKVRTIIIRDRASQFWHTIELSCRKATLAASCAHRRLSTCYCGTWCICAARHVAIQISNDMVFCDCNASRRCTLHSLVADAVSQYQYRRHESFNFACTFFLCYTSVAIRLHDRSSCYFVLEQLNSLTASFVRIFHHDVAQ